MITDPIPLPDPGWQNVSLPSCDPGIAPEWLIGIGMTLGVLIAFAVVVLAARKRRKS